MIKLAGVLIASIAAVSAAPLLAHPTANDEIVISASGNQISQRSVQYRDLALGQSSGQARLMHRVGYAIESMCENSVASPNPVGAMKCSNVAWDNVRPQLDRLLKR